MYGDWPLIELGPSIVESDAADSGVLSKFSEDAGRKVRLVWCFDFGFTECQSCRVLDFYFIFDFIVVGVPGISCGCKRAGFGCERRFQIEAYIVEN